MRPQVRIERDELDQSLTETSEAAKAAAQVPFNRGSGWQGVEHHGLANGSHNAQPAVALSNRSGSRRNASGVGSESEPRYK
jgi:hypothetical protein